MRRRLKIELVGLPGAGKTTLADRLVAALREHGVCCVTRAEAQRSVSALHAEHPSWKRWLRYLAHAASEPGVSRAALRLAARTRPQVAKGYWRAYCLTRHAHNDSLLRATAPRGAVIVLDQDILQEVWGVLYLRSCSDERDLRRLLVALRHRLPDIVLHCRVDGATALERIAERRQRLGPLGDVDRMTWMTPEVLGRAGIESLRIARMAADVAGARLLEVDSTQAVDDQLAVVFHALADVPALGKRESQVTT